MRDRFLRATASLSETRDRPQPRMETITGKRGVSIASSAIVA